MYYDTKYIYTYELSVIVLVKDALGQSWYVSSFQFDSPFKDLEKEEHCLPKQDDYLQFSCPKSIPKFTKNKYEFITAYKKLKHIFVDNIKLIKSIKKNTTTYLQAIEDFTVTVDFDYEVNDGAKGAFNYDIKAGTFFPTSMYNHSIFMDFDGDGTIYIPTDKVIEIELTEQQESMLNDNCFRRLNWERFSINK